MTKHKQQKKRARAKSIKKQVNMHANNLKSKITEVQAPVILPVWDSKEDKYVTEEIPGGKIKATKFAIVGQKVVKIKQPKP